MPRVRGVLAAQPNPLTGALPTAYIRFLTQQKALKQIALVSEHAGSANASSTCTGMASVRTKRGAWRGGGRLLRGLTAYMMCGMAWHGVGSVHTSVQACLGAFSAACISAQTCLWQAPTSMRLAGHVPCVPPCPALQRLLKGERKDRYVPED